MASEARQIAIVDVFLPLAQLLRRTWRYSAFVLAGGAVAIVVAAALWFVKRALSILSSRLVYGAGRGKAEAGFPL
jgi:hypothetical protein